MIRTFVLVVAMASLAGCALLQPRQREFYPPQAWDADTEVAFTGGDLRMITERTHPVLKTKVVCAEPSPDEAKAFSSAVQANASVGRGAANGSVGGVASSAEAIAELAGRSTALLGLRDGLSQACQAFANGIIGSDAYALVLSRYGQLMTTLFLGQDISASAAKDGAGAQSPTVTLGTGGAASPASKPGGASSPPAANQSSAAPVPALPAAAIVPAALVLAANTPPPAPATPAPATPKSPTDSTTGQTGTGTQPTATGASVSGISAGAAVALVRMNEDYLALDLDPLHLLIVACINEFDPTRNKPPSGDVNSWLKPICESIKDMNTIAETEAKLLAMISQYYAMKPADPTLSVSAGSAGAGAQQKNAAAGKCPSTAIQKLQQALQAKGFSPGAIDCVDGPKTVAALKQFQSQNHLPATGQLDDETSQALGLTAAKPAPAKGT